MTDSCGTVHYSTVPKQRLHQLTAVDWSAQFVAGEKIGLSSPKVNYSAVLKDYIMINLQR